MKKSMRRGVRSTAPSMPMEENTVTSTENGNWPTSQTTTIHQNTTSLFFHIILEIVIQSTRTIQLVNLPSSLFMRGVEVAQIVYISCTDDRALRRLPLARLLITNPLRFTWHVYPRRRSFYFERLSVYILPTTSWILVLIRLSGLWGSVEIDWGLLGSLSYSRQRRRK